MSGIPYRAKCALQQLIVLGCQFRKILNTNRQVSESAFLQFQTDQCQLWPEVCHMAKVVLSGFFSCGMHTLDSLKLCFLFENSFLASIEYLWLDVWICLLPNVHRGLSSLFVLEFFLGLWLAR